MQAGRWNWLDDGLLPLLLAAMRAAWLWPLLLLLHAFLAPSQAGPVLPLWALIAVPFLSFALTRHVLPEQEDPHALHRLNRIRVGIAVTGLLVLLILLWWHFYREHFPLWSAQWLVTLVDNFTRWDTELPVEVLAVLAGVYLWMQGVLTGRAPIYHEDIWRTFITGAALLALVLWLNQVSESPVAMRGVTWVLIFFACGMAALAATNLKMASGWSLFGSSGGQPQVNRYWVLSITLTVLGLLALGLLVAFLIAPEDVAWLLALGRTALAAVGQVLYWIVLGLSYVFFAIFYVFYWLIRPLIDWLRRDEETPEPEFEMPQPPAGFDEEFMEMGDPAAMPDAFRWIAVVVLAIGILIAFVVVLRRLRAAPIEEAEEIRESVYSSDLLQEQMATLWQNWRNWFQHGGQAGPAYLDLSGEVDTRRTIRAVYQQLLAAAAARGTPRRAAQTPREYQPQLRDQLLAADAALTMITEKYMQARYAADPPPSEAATQVQEAWKEIEERLQERADD